MARPDDIVGCVAVHCVTADRVYLPGEALELSREDADALEAGGAVRRAEPEPEPAPLTDVKGIGAKVAGQLAGAGIRSVAANTLSSTDELARVASTVSVVGDPLAAVTRWRDEARQLIEAEADGA